MPLAPRWLVSHVSYNARRWMYGTIEVISVGLFAMGFFVLFIKDQATRVLVDNTPGMARLTGACFVGTGLALYLITITLKRIDPERRA